MKNRPNKKSSQKIRKNQYLVVPLGGDTPEHLLPCRSLSSIHGCRCESRCREMAKFSSWERDIVKGVMNATEAMPPRPHTLSLASMGIWLGGAILCSVGIGFLKRKMEGIKALCFEPLQNVACLDQHSSKKQKSCRSSTAKSCHVPERKPQDAATKKPFVIHESVPDSYFDQAKQDNTVFANVKRRPTSRRRPAIRPKSGPRTRR